MEVEAATKAAEDVVGCVYSVWPSVPHVIAARPGMLDR